VVLAAILGRKLAKEAVSLLCGEPQLLQLHI
jgi:hypothetical protein